jgi:hypothetical protein
VADTVEGLMPALMEIFAAGEEVVRFDPVGPEDEDAAMQETDYVNHVFMQKNPGFLVLYTFIKDALLSKNGIVKVFWDETEKQERETYLDQPDDAFAVMAADPDVDVAEHTEHKDDQGQITHDVTLVRKKTAKLARVVPVPPEEFGITRRARAIKDSTYCFHQVRDRTEADLIAQKYDEAGQKASLAQPLHPTGTIRPRYRGEGTGRGCGFDQQAVSPGRCHRALRPDGL